MVNYKSGVFSKIALHIISFLWGIISLVNYHIKKEHHSITNNVHDDTYDRKKMNQRENILHKKTLDTRFKPFLGKNFTSLFSINLPLTPSVNLLYAAHCTAFD